MKIENNLCGESSPLLEGWQPKADGVYLEKFTLFSILHSQFSIKLLLFLISFSHADFLGLNVVEKEEPPPFFVYGANYTMRIFAGGLDNFAGAKAHFRINKNFALGGDAEVDLNRKGFLAGAFLHYLPTGEIMKEGAENFVHFGVDYINIESEHSPLFSVGYGRDMLPWKKSSFGFRVLGKIEYAPASHIFMRENDGSGTTLAKTDISIEIGVFMVR